MIKTTSRVILRSLTATPLRIAMIYAGIIALLYFDFRPLPEWTSDAVAYFIHFAVTYLLTWWVLHKVSGRRSDAFVVAFNFIVVGGLLELFLAALLRGPSIQLIQGVFTWQSGLLHLIYILAVALATLQVRGNLRREASQA